MTTTEKLRTLVRDLGEGLGLRSAQPTRSGARPPTGRQGGDGAS